MYYDTDESNAEFLIQHFPLADVLAFVHVRDEVRRIAAAMPVDADVAPATAPTLPAAGNVRMRSAVAA